MCASCDLVAKSPEEQAFEERMAIERRLTEAAPNFASRYSRFENFEQDGERRLQESFKAVNTPLEVSDLHKVKIETDIQQLTVFIELLQQERSVTQLESIQSELDEILISSEERLEAMRSVESLSQYEELSTLGLITDYMMTKGAGPDVMEQKELLRWARLLCNYDNSTPEAIRQWKKYRAQPSLYPEYPKQLRSYVQEEFATHSSQDKVKVRLKIPLGQYQNDGFLLSSITEPMNVANRNDDIGMRANGTLLVRLQDGFKSTRRIQSCGSWSEVRYGDITGVNDKYPAVSTGLLIALSLSEEMRRDLSKLLISVEEARRLTQQNKRFLYADLFFDGLKSVPNEFVSGEDKVGFSTYTRKYGLIEGQLQEVIFYDFSEERQQVRDGLTGGPGGTRAINRLGDVIYRVSRE